MRSQAGASPWSRIFVRTAIPAPAEHLFAALPAADYECLLPQLEFLSLPPGWAIYESGIEQGYVYFPTTSIVSLL